MDKVWVILSVAIVILMAALFELLLCMAAWIVW
jgi:hypothetical protein